MSYGNQSQMQNSGRQAVRMTQFKSELVKGVGKFGGIVSSGCVKIAEQMSRKYDFVIVDVQHSAISAPEISAMVQGISLSTVSFVRVCTPSDEINIQLALDSGADGIIFPNIRNVQEAKQAIELCLYPPLGKRSAFPYIREILDADLWQHLQEANSSIMKILLVETQECLENLEAILSLKPGFDVALMGPFDLSVSHSLHEKYSSMADIMSSAELKSAMELVVKACEKHGVVPGSVALQLQSLKTQIAMGYKFFITGFDLDMMDLAIQSNLQMIDDVKKSLK